METRPVSWPAGAAFMCYTIGQKVWKFHGERSCDKMPGEEVPSSSMGQDVMRVKRSSTTSYEGDARKIGRSCSTGSSYCSSESECSSQPSPINEPSEDIANEFLSPVSPDESVDSSSEYGETHDHPQTPQELPKAPCPPPSPVGPRSQVDVKALNDLINTLLRKHALVQNGLELLKRQPALALRLQQRRPRKVLADQGIIPPLKSPATYYEQVQKLERARTGDFLNKKMQDRPERELLVQKHILEDTSAYDSIVAHQKELKKAKLVDDLNEKIFFRPGVFELVEKNILPADETVAEALKGGHVQYKKTDDFAEEDSSDAFSPEQPASHDQGTSPSFGSPPSSVLSFSPAMSTSMQSPPTLLTRVSSASSLSSWSAQPSPPPSCVAMTKHDSLISSSSSKMPRSSSSTHTTAGHPYLMRQASGTKTSKVTPSTLSQRNLRKKKEKPKFKKFKYHQYIPPDQGKSSEQLLPNMDTPYSRLLEQQQLYLQLQIMNQHYPTLLSKPTVDPQMKEVKNTFSVPVPPPAPPIGMDQKKKEKKQRNFTVQQLEEMKVAELKEELKARGQKVTGTKEVLVDRLKRFAAPSSTRISPNMMSQPISESITGLINATIQSTIRANTEQALAAAVNNNGLLRARTLSPPIQQKSDGQQVLRAQISPPPRFASKVVGIQVVSPHEQQKTRIKIQPANTRPLSVVPMDTQNQDQQIALTRTNSQPSTFHFTTTSNGVQIFSTTPALNTNSTTGKSKQTTANKNMFFSNVNNASKSETTAGNSGIQQQTSVPGQRVISAAPAVQFKVEGAGSSDSPYNSFKDQLLHKQQKEIEDLRRMVELHRTQLHQIQEKERKSQSDMPSSNNNASNSNQIMEQQDQNNNGMAMIDQQLNRQHISQVLQKHLQNRLNNKEQQPTINGLNQQMQIVKQEVHTQENVFNFSGSAVPPNVSLVPMKQSTSESSNSSIGQDQDAPVILSVKPPLERSLSENKDPPKYDQAIQMLNQEKQRHNHFGSQENMVGSPDQGGTGEMTSSDMDDLLELLTDKGEIPVTPTHQKAFPQQVVVDNRHQHQHATMHYHMYNGRDQSRHNDQAAMHRRSMEHLHRSISGNELDNMQHHRRSLELPTLVPLSDQSQGFLRKDPNLQRRHSGDPLACNEPHTGLTPLLADHQTDFTSLLVSSAGDILMDATRVPPSGIQGRMNYPTCLSPESVALQQHQESSMHNVVSRQQDDMSKNHGNAYLNLNDPYATQPFSPMDTGSCDAHGGVLIEDRVRDPHLSSSSIHDSETSLDKCLDGTLPSSTGSYLRHYGQPLAAPSPQRHSHLTKSSSQELLSANSPGMDHSMQVDELGWLDLTLGSPLRAPPSPMNLHQRASMHSSVGSILEHDENPGHSYLGGDGFLSGNDGFGIDIIDSLDLNSITSGQDDWGGL